MDVATYLPPPIPLALALALAGHGLRKGSLSASGALAAFVVGGLMCAVQLRTFAVSLIGFYLIGSRATKVQKDTKRKLEEGYDVGSKRNAFQVICNSFAAFVGSVAWSAAFADGNRDVFVRIMSHSARILSMPMDRDIYDGASWCAIDPQVASGWSRFLVFAALGHFACCLGDTLASELGILSKSPPILITTFKPVPPGTNGGLSRLGTVASVLGGLIMGLMTSLSLLIENAACRVDAVSHVVALVAWGAFGGLAGSLIDSLLGATVQETRYSKTKSHVLTDDSEHAHDEDVKVVSGIRVLTNNQINLVSSTLTALLLAYWSS